MQKMFVIVLVLMLAGCVTTQKTINPDGAEEAQAFQARTFEASDQVLFKAALAGIQDQGYIIDSADAANGLIIAQGETKTRVIPIATVVMTETKITALIKSLQPGHSELRLTLVEAETATGSGGMKTTQKRIIKNPAAYEDVFKNIYFE